MSDKGTLGKVEIKIGNLSFTAEGEQTWLSEQLAKVIEAAGKVANEAPAPGGQHSPGSGAARTLPSGSLSSYLKAKGGESKQVQRFLATAAWLYRKNGTNLTTASVTKALSDNHQKKLGNPADCLNQNCGKGYCEKTKEGFYITPEGWKHLGEEA